VPNLDPLEKYRWRRSDVVGVDGDSSDGGGGGSGDGVRVSSFEAWWGLYTVCVCVDLQKRAALKKLNAVAVDP
jgi:hypothetical protein